MSKYEALTTALTVLPTNEPIYSEMATKIYLDDEAAGLFVVVEQQPDRGTQKITFDEEEWPVLRAAINRLVNIARARNAKKVTHE